MLTTSGLGILPRIDVNGINRTGAAMVAGGVYALDLFAADGTSVDAQTEMANVVAISANNIRGFLVVAMTAVAAGASGKFMLKGYDSVLVDATTPILKADRLIPTAASVNLTKQPNPSLVNPCAITPNALGSGVGVLMQCYFNGEAWKGERAAS